MNRYLPFLLMLLAAAIFGACGDHHESDDHGHEHGHDHDGHDHDDDDHEHGEKTEIGSAQIGEHSVTLAVFGEIEAGHEAVLDIDVEGAPVAAVRAWVGVASGRGSLKANIEGKEGEYHGHLEVPGALPDGSEIWIELEGPNGKKTQASFKIPK